MAIDFKKFNQQFPADKMRRDMAEAAKNGGNFEQLPEGEYTVKLDKMELGESSKGALMIKAQFRIIEGDHKNQCIFVNRVLTGTKNDGFMMIKAQEFLDSMDSGIAVNFEDWEQFNDLILDIAEAVQADGLTYLVCLSENEKNPKYQDFEIIDVYEN
jgi:hypothetical protein